METKINNANLKEILLKINLKKENAGWKQYNEKKSKKQVNNLLEVSF